MPTIDHRSSPRPRPRISPGLRRAAAAAGCAVVLGACSSAAAVGTSSTTRPATTSSTAAGSTTTGSTIPSSSTTSTTSPTVTTAPPPAGDTASPALVTTPGENLPDPFILKVPGGYELYSSQTGLYGPTIPTAFSTTLYHWPAVHAAMPAVPSWATFGFTWAPDVRHLDGRYVMYFDSLAQPSIYYDEAGSGFSHYAQCIGVATALAPGGPFVGQSHPLICDLSAHGAIDPRTFLAPGGELYLDWKSDNNAANPAPFSDTNLYAQLLTPNGLALAGSPHLLLTADAPWQSEIVEAPDMVQVRGKYWLFYSGSWFNGSRYGVGFASCAGPTGPCTDKSLAGPWIGTNEQGSGPGEESVFESPTGQWWMAYSPWYFGYQGGTSRPVAMAALGFGAGGPYVAKQPAETGAT